MCESEVGKNFLGRFSSRLIVAPDCRWRRRCQVAFRGPSDPGVRAAVARSRSSGRSQRVEAPCPNLRLLSCQGEGVALREEDAWFCFSAQEHLRDPGSGRISQHQPNPGGKRQNQDGKELPPPLPCPGVNRMRPRGRARKRVRRVECRRIRPRRARRRAARPAPRFPRTVDDPGRQRFRPGAGLAHAGPGRGSLG